VLGIAGAALMPSTLALISNMFRDARECALAIGLWATMFALGMAAGPMVGGVLVKHFDWGAAFLVAVPVIAVLLVTAPILLPEYRAPVRGRFDLLSVALSLAAMLPMIYAVKESARSGVAFAPVAALLTGLAFAVLFVRRQSALVSPLLDLRLFANGTFSAALAILLVGLIGVGGAMLLVTQYLQFVVGLPPVTAGLWMGPPALMMLVAGIAAPLIARRIRAGLVVAGALALSTAGYGLLALLAAVPDIGLVIAGYSLVYLGLGTIAALGTDLVVGAAPPEKAGSASALSETVQELGLAVGVATLGSLSVALYREQIRDRIPANLPETLARAVEDSLWAASSVAERLPAGLIDEARTAFTCGLVVASIVAAIGTAILAILSAMALRR
ncbi:MAG: MFS transporter, partial [Solimonas sp.]